MEDSLITREKDGLRKTIGKTLKRDINVNDLNINIMIYNRVL